MNSKKNERTTKPGSVANGLTVVLFIIYLIALCWILLFKLGVQFSYMGERSVNFMPFNEPSILSSENISNAVIFVPLGIYTGALFGRWVFVKKLLFFFLLSLTVEALQYILRIGAFDVTDIITNSFGGIAGLTIFTAIDKAFSNPVKTQKLINIMAATGTILILLFLVLLKMNMLPIRYQ